MANVDPMSRYRFFGACALLFLACAMLTADWHGASSAVRLLPLCDGATTSAMWLRMPGWTWPGAAASFLCMWTVMMTAMMLPAVAPTLWRYAASAAPAGPGRLAALAAGGYVAAWAGLGAIVYPVGAALAAIQSRQPVFAQAAPFMAAGIVAAAGVLQFTRWKARQLACCRYAPTGHGRMERTHGAWRYGMRLGWHCIQSCAGLTAALLATGLMDAGAMAAAAIAIAAERLTPGGAHVARTTGALLVLAGLLMAARAGSPPLLLQ